MSVEANPFYEPLMAIWGRLNFISGLLHLLSNHLSNYGKMLRQTLTKHGKDFSRIMLGKSLPITDLTGRTDAGWLLQYPSGAFTAHGEEYLRMAEVIIRRESAWAVVQGYEAFETFLKDSLAAFLLPTPSAADTEKLRKFDTQAECPRDRAQVLYWKHFVRYAYSGRNNQDLFRVLRRCAPGLNKAERDNTRRIDLPKWYSAVSVARHAVTHSNLRIPPHASSRVPDEKVFFPCENEDGERILNLKEKNADRCLQTFAEYAFQVFKFLSKATGNEWDILEKGSRPGKMRVRCRM